MDDPLKKNTTSAKVVSSADIQTLNTSKLDGNTQEINGYISEVLLLATRGWPVFPCGADKRPLIATGFHAASLDSAQIRTWWEHWPDALVGVATGASSGVTVLDIDVKEGQPGLVSLQDLVQAHGPLPSTLVAETRSGGFHYFFQNVEGARNSASKIAPGIDVRSDGGYVIASPSAGYRWLVVDAEIAEAPEWLKALLAPVKELIAQPMPAMILREKHPDDVVDRARKYLANVPEAVAGQGGHGQTYAAAVAMVHGFELDENVAVDLLLSEYNPRCVGPWSEAEIRHKVADALTKPHEKPRGHLLNAKPALITRSKRDDHKVPDDGNVVNVAEQHLGKSLDDSDGNHATIVVEILTQMQRRGLAVDALGNFRDEKTWSRVACDPVAFSEDLAFTLRRDGMRVDAARVGETLRTLARTDATKRRQSLTSTFLGKPSSGAGLQEVRRWVRAVTGEERQVDVAAMLHWLWLVKNRVAGRHGELHVMIIVFGLMQGTGKSQAVLHLCAPWCELFDPEISIETITDERNAPHLANCAVGLWDELGGLAKADMEKLKHRMTATTVSYRPMRTNSRIELPALMSFIGSSNRSIGELVKDSTGMRRFYEIRASEAIDWNEINGINYALLWQAVSEDDKPPGQVHRQIIAAEQLRLVWRDPVQRWIEDEDDMTWGANTSASGFEMDRQDPVRGISNAVLYERFTSWLKSSGEREVSKEVMGRRLTELGWTLFRLSRAQGQAKAYCRQTKVPLHTVHTHAQASGDGEVCTPVHGVPPHVCLSANEGAP